MNGPGSSILIWMRPNMRRDLALLRELHVHAGRISRDRAFANRVQGWPRFQGRRFDRTPKLPEHAQRCCRYRQRGCYPRVGVAWWGAPQPGAEGPYSEHGGWGCLGGAAVPGGVLQHADGCGHLAGSGRRAKRQEGCGAVEALAPLVWNRQAGSPWKPE